MNREEFRKILDEKILVLDGATGTELQKRAMPTGVCPELWALENPGHLIEIHKEYVEAGSDVIYTFTLGATRVKLDEYGAGGRTVEINRRLAEIAKTSAGGRALVAGDVSTTGRFVEPFGDLEFEQAVQLFSEQIRGLVEGGVDLIVIETMIDIQEARAALIAAKETCSLPVCVCMTYDKGKRTLTGTDPITAVVTLQSLGADAVGCNCSTGPAEMVDIIARMKEAAYVPIIAKPNAGIPVLKNGRTCFTMGAGEFGSYIDAFIKNGVNIVGGCCGTTPEFITQIVRRTAAAKPVPCAGKRAAALTSARKTVFIGKSNPLTIIGERINPTGKKKLQKSLAEMDLSEVRKLAAEQAANGAAILDVNAGIPGIDEVKTVKEIVKALSGDMDTPLCIDSSNPEVIETALRIYPGRALVNSISGEKEKMERLLPAAAKYGAMFILLPLDDGGVPQTLEARCSVIQKVFEHAEKLGFTKDDILADGLAMTVSSDQGAAKVALDVIDWCANKFGCRTILGLSNISYGLPQRQWINGAFLAMAAQKGLNCAIANPSSEIMEGIRLASDVLTGRDRGSVNYIARYAEVAKREDTIVKRDDSLIKRDDAPAGTGSRDTLELIYDCVVKGDMETVHGLVDKALAEGAVPENIINGWLIPAITHVGELFEKKEYFLPQLLRSAETMKKAFEHLKPFLESEGKGERKRGPVVVLATVKGDIHDIGKNIVGLMLSNHGFDVLDLGKDVDARVIVSKARETGAQIVGLSALMTTTMVEMKNVINLAKREGLNCRFMIGGAAVNAAFAGEIGADGYAEDANKAVKLAKELVERS